MAKHPGDDGNWNLDAADLPRMTLQQKIDTQPTVVSQEVRDAVRGEEAFLRSVTGVPNTKRFTDRRNPPDRNHTTPWGPDRKG